jgi:malonyl-CoA/methylmalonyl-CoA synthetase
MSENLFTSIAAQTADLDAVLIHDPDGATLSYGQAFARTAQFANVLRQLGVEPGDRVAVQVEKSADAMLLYLGCLRAGAVFLPLNTGYTGPELAYFLGDAEPRVFVVDPTAAKAADAVRREAGVAHLETLGASGAGDAGSLADAADAADQSFNDVARTADDLAAILYTSGTTGHSKGAMLTHGNLASNATALADYWRFGREDVLLHALPIFRDHPPAAPGDDDDGRADFLYPAADPVRFRPRLGSAHAAVRLGLRALVRRNAQGIQSPHRSRDPRALWHDRDQHEHLQPL